MKVVIIDDEEAMHLILSRMLKKVADIEIIGMFQDTDQALFFIENNPVDIVLLDIHLPKENGIEFAKKLIDKNKNIPIIFITVYKDYALEAFDVLAIDYIVKPITFERLQKAIMRAIAIRQYTFLEERFEDDNQVSIYCFGGLEIRTKQGTVKWLSRKSAEIFSYLLFQRGRMVFRESIIENIFPNMPQKNAETYLNTAIYQLRKSLSIVGVKSMVFSNKDVYGLDLSNIYIDFIDSEEKVRKFG